MPEIDVVATLRIKHGGLHDAVKKCGSQRKLSKLLGVHQMIVGEWCNLKSCPPDIPRARWPQDRIDGLEKALFELTGQTLIELFPADLREAILNNAAPKTVERRLRIKAASLAQLGSSQSERLLIPSPIDTAEAIEQVERIARVLKTLNQREQLIVTRRFGLDGAPSGTYEEIGRALSVTRERVRQIEARAIRHLQHPDRSASLVDYIN